MRIMEVSCVGLVSTVQIPALIWRRFYKQFLWIPIPVRPPNHTSSGTFCVFCPPPTLYLTRAAWGWDHQQLYNMTRGHPHSSWEISMTDLQFRVLQRDQPAAAGYWRNRQQQTLARDNTVTGRLSSWLSVVFVRIQMLLTQSKLGRDRNWVCNLTKLAIGNNKFHQPYPILDGK